MKPCAAALAAALALLSCATDPGEGAREGVRFRDVSDAGGIRLGNYVENPAAPIPRNDHARIRCADLDGDGLEDLVMHSMFPNPQKGIPFETLVFLADGDGTFRDFTAESGLRDVQAGFMLFADFDDDGDQDAFAGLDVPIAGRPNNQVLLNDGRGHFTRLVDAGVEYPECRYTANAVAADFDNDGILDLFVGNGSSVAPVRDDVFRGNGDGTFMLREGALEPKRIQPTNGSVAFDFDRDGDLDVFASTYGVSFSRGHDQLWENRGGLRFFDAAREKGVAAQRTGNSWMKETGYGRLLEPYDDPELWIGGNGFGVDAADINADGLPDVYLANISHPTPYDRYRTWSDPSQVLVNRGPGAGFAFRSEALERKLPFNEGEIDAAALDIDNDGFFDLAVSRERKYEGGYATEAQKGWFGVMRQNRDGTFMDVSLSCGINAGGPWEAMKQAGNQAWFDMDGDGDLDVLIGGGSYGAGRPNFLFENLSGAGNAWIAIRVRGDGKKVNRDGIGTEVSFDMDGRTLLETVVSSRGTYASQDTRTLHFGFGAHRGPLTARVRWPDGKGETYTFSRGEQDRAWVWEYGSGPRKP